MSEIRAADQALPLRRRLLVDRHTRVTRLTHWINLLCVTVLLMSGLQIFNAHPALYWGQSGADADRPLFEIGADDSGGGPPAGFARIGSSTFNTTGILGVSRNASGEVVLRGFPRWVTLPGWRDLALGRRWHFFFAWVFVANLLVYLVAGLASGHFWRDLLPSPRAAAATRSSPGYRQSSPAQISARRGGAALQSPPETDLSRRRLRAVATDDPDRPRPCRRGWMRSCPGSSTCLADANPRGRSISSRPA